MDCPRCQYHSPYQQTRCPSCSTTFETMALEELGHLRFLHMQLRHWRTNGILPPVGAGEALLATERRIATVEISLGLRPAPWTGAQPTQATPPPAPAAVIVAEPATPTVPTSVAPTPSVETPAAAPPQPTPSPAPVAPVAPEEPAAPEEAAMPEAPAAPREAAPAQPAPSPARVDEAPRATPPRPPAPTPTPAPAPRPAFSWGQVGTSLLSERTLNGLLSLGAFLILTSGTVISVFNPTGLPPILHFASTVITTLLFYFAGLFLRQKLGLPRTGTVLLAIGAAFIPLTIWTLGQETLLNWEREAIWLTAALICLPIYFGSHLLLRDRTFALLTAIAGGAEVFTILTWLDSSPWLDIPLEWRLCALVLLAIRYLTLADRLRERWDTLAWALIWAAQVVTPFILAVTLLGRWEGEFWRAVNGGIEPSGTFNIAVAVAWWLGVAYYALAARRLTGRAYPYIAAWGLPIALLLTLSATPLDRAWHNLPLVLLAFVALAWGRWRQRALADEARPGLIAIFTQPAYQLALVLPVFAGFWPAQTLDSRVLTLFATVGLYALAAWFFRQMPLRAVAAYLLIPAVAYGLQLTVRSSRFDWLYDWHGLVWALLAGGYLLFARFALRVGRVGDGAYRYFGLAIEPVANAILPITVLAIITSPPMTGGQLAAFLALALVYGTATFLLRQRVWAWPSVAFLALAALPAFDLLRLSDDARPLAWTILAVALLVAAEIAAWRTGEARRPLLATVLGQGDWRSRFAAPLFAFGYALGALALVLGLMRADDARPAGFIGGFYLSNALLAAFFVLVAVLVASAVTRRTSRFLYLACAVFPLPYAAAIALIARDQGLFLADHDAARWFALLGTAYLLIALATERAGVRYAVPVWLAGYAFILAMPIMALADRMATVQTLGLTIVLLAASALLAHFDRHRSFLAFARAFASTIDSAEHQTTRALFLYGATWLFPIWAVFALSLRKPDTQIFGLMLALLAPLYVLLGVWFRAIRPAYRWPWYLCGYLLSAIGPIVAVPGESLRIVALAVSIGLWIASAAVTRRAPWLYPVALFTPVLVWEICARLKVDWDYAGLVTIGISLAYATMGMVLHRGWQQPVGPVRGWPSRHAWPFFGMGQWLAVLAMGLTTFSDGWLDVATFALAALGYAYVAWLFRQPVFVWPATVTATIAYAIGMTLTPLPDTDYNVGLLPLLFVALLAADLLRRFVDDTSPAAEARSGAQWLLLAWATPCYALAYGGTIWVVAYYRADNGSTALGWWGVTALYALSTILFLRPLSLYPALGAMLAAILATARVIDPDLPAARLLALLIVPAWVLAAVADVIASLRPVERAETPDRWPFLGAERLIANEWAAPPLAFALGALILATVSSATDTGVGLIAALAGTALLAIVATRWRGEAEAWGAIGSATLTFWHLLRYIETPSIEQGTRWALLALALTLVAIGLRALPWSLLDPWRRPLSLGAMAYAAWALGIGFVYALGDPAGQQTLAFTLAITGLTLIAHGFDRRERLLGYAGVACLEAGYMVHLFVHEIGQPQAFALPAGIFLLAVAYLEWRRGTGAGIKATLEVAALSILLTVTAIQTLGYLSDFVPQRDAREVYGSFMLIEAVVLLALGAVLRWRRTFFGGGLGIVLAVGLLLFDPFRSLNAWYVAAIIGFTMITLVIFIEQRRQQIPVWLGEWRARLEEWD